MSYSKPLYVLPSVTYATATSSVTSLRDLPKQLLGRLAHLAKLTFGLTNTQTSATSLTTIEKNNIFSAVDFSDGVYNRFVGGLNHMRLKEAMETGRIRVPDSDDQATGAAGYWRRTLHMGPSNFAGAPHDFAIPCGCLETGELRFTHNAMATVDSGLSALTASSRVVASLILLDEFNIPPAYQFGNSTPGAADFSLPGRAVYDKIAMLNSASFDAITGGDFGAWRVNFGSGDYVASVQGEDITAAWQDDFACGQVGTIGGEPTASTDDNGKIVNYASPTAVAAQEQSLQMVIHTPPGAKISKLPRAETSTNIKWSGTATTGVLLWGRILEQVPSDIGRMGVKAVGRLGLSVRSTRIKTLSKRDYTGPYVGFMPYVIKV